MKTALIACALGVLLTVPANAQSLAGRIGGGAVVAGDVGEMALIGVEARLHSTILRVDARGIMAGDRAQMVFVGGGIGKRFSPARAHRAYALAAAAYGIDPREADASAAFGALIGIEARRAPVFAELRGEKCFQTNGARHYTLPTSQLTLTIGVRIGGAN